MLQPASLPLFIPAPLVLSEASAMSDRDPKLPNAPAPPVTQNKPPAPPTRPNPNAPPVIEVDAATLLAVIVVILFVPLLITGFISH